ncbi:MAG: rRNA maturation RNase YbeY [Anaerolineales bacterium]
MNHRVLVRGQPRYLRYRRAVASAGRAALAAARARRAELTLVLTGDRELRRLNRRFASVDRSTDVLSFGSGEPASRQNSRYLGDVVISVPRARRQAQSSGHPLDTELALLVVHGVLHLLGYDHARPLDRRRMSRLHARALGRLGLRLRHDPLLG